MCKIIIKATYRMICFHQLYIVVAIFLFNPGRRLLCRFVVCLYIIVFNIRLIYLFNHENECLCPHKQQSTTTVDFRG